MSIPFGLLASTILLLTMVLRPDCAYEITAMSMRQYPNDRWRRGDDDAGEI